MIRRWFGFVARHRALFARVSTVLLVLLIVVSESAQEGSIVAPCLFMMGLVLIGVATVGRLWCALYISGRKSSELVTAGPYSISRNPLYLFSLIGFVGVGLATETVTIPLAVVAVFTATYPGLIASEEAHLRQAFGAEFEDYCARTPRFLPRFSAYQEAETWAVNPRIFRRTMLNALSFIWLAGLVEFVEALHELHLIQPLLQLP
jgi:protein-S-isoprenylcysteine O-methyltransferase Ste14